MSGLVWNGVLGPSGRDRDVGQKQDPAHPANDLLTNRKGAAEFMEVHPPAQKPARFVNKREIKSAYSIRL
jgi:hypothetical protein